MSGKASPGVFVRDFAGNVLVDEETGLGRDEYDFYGVVEPCHPLSCCGWFRLRVLCD